MAWSEIMWWWAALWLVPGITAYFAIRYAIKLDSKGKWTVVNRVVTIILSLGGAISLAVGLMVLAVSGCIKWAESKNGQREARW